MLIARRKFRPRTLAYSIRLCHVNMQHARNVGPILFARNAWRAHVGKPAALIICGAPGITYGHAIRTSRTISIKINHFTF